MAAGDEVMVVLVTSVTVLAELVVLVTGLVLPRVVESVGVLTKNEQLHIRS